MLIKTFIILAAYLALLLMFIQMGFTMAEKANTELDLFIAEFANLQGCTQISLLQKAGGNSVYDIAGDCHG